VSVLVPRVSLVPATVNAAEAIPEETVNGAVPKAELPRKKLTVPDGSAAPLAGLTNAVTVVFAFWAMVGGVAATVVVVATVGALTVTIAEVEHPLNLISPP
jgi:hypothetical protein